MFNETLFLLLHKYNFDDTFLSENLSRRYWYKGNGWNVTIYFQMENEKKSMDTSNGSILDFTS